MPTGQYTVNEIVPADWTLSNIVCDDANSTVDTGAAAATINLGKNDMVTCTFYNTYDAPGDGLLYIAPNRNNGVVGGVAYNDEDIVVNTLGTSDWACTSTAPTWGWPPAARPSTRWTCCPMATW